MKTIKKLVCLGIGLASLSAVSQVQAGSVAVFGDRFNLSVINNFYDVLPEHDSTIIPSLTAGNLAGIDLLWAVQPADAYTPAELSAMGGFLAGGGRIAFMGEHGGFAPIENANITAGVASLGGHISITANAVDGGFRDATVANGQILAHALTAGVNTYNYAAFAPLLHVGAGAEVLMLGSNLTDIMMAYENIGAGSIFLITDQNVWDNVNSASNDNARMFENLLEADTGAPPAGVPDGGATASLLALSSIVLLGTKKVLKGSKR